MSGIFLNPSRCCGCGEAALSCSPCPIPKNDLTLCWWNALIGPGSAPLVYDPIGKWTTACTKQMLYQLSCPGGSIQFTATYFLSGECRPARAKTARVRDTTRSRFSWPITPAHLSCFHYHVTPVRGARCCSLTGTPIS